MDAELALIFFLTFVIHLIGTLAYSVRIAGTRTGRIAVSLALFNVLVLVSRTSNSFQSPLLAKRVEENLDGRTGLEADFRWLLVAATLATLLGALLIPTFQRLFARAVVVFSRYRSVPRLMLAGMSPAGLAHLRASLRMPAAANLTQLRAAPRLPLKVVALNALATAVWTVGVFASLYAGCLSPEYRSTAGQLSGVINGVATIMMFVLIDPYLSVLTDEAVEGKISDGFLPALGGVADREPAGGHRAGADALPPRGRADRPRGRAAVAAARARDRRRHRRGSAFRGGGFRVSLPVASPVCASSLGLTETRRHREVSHRRLLCVSVSLREPAVS